MMITCYSMIVAIFALNKHTVEDVMHLAGLTPIHRLKFCAIQNESIACAINRVICDCDWFIQQYSLGKKDVLAQLLNEPYRKTAFAKVDDFGRNMFSALQIFDKKSGFMWYLVVYWIVSFYFRNVAL